MRWQITEVSAVSNIFASHEPALLLQFFCSRVWTRGQRSFWDQGQRGLSEGQGGHGRGSAKKLGLQPTQKGRGEAEDIEEMVSQ